MNTNEKRFWQDLEISVDDILEYEKTGKRPVTRLHNKLKHVSGWIRVINDNLGTKYESLLLLLRHLFRYRKLEFYRIFFLVEFVESVERDSIKNRLPDGINLQYKKEIDEKTVSYDSLVYSIYKHDHNIITNIWYDHLVTKASLKMYKSDNIIDAEQFLLNLDIKSIEEFFTKLNLENVIKRTSKVWWFENRENKTKIFVRLESKRRRPIHQISRNTFLKTAGDRIIIFSNKGNQLEILSKEPAVANWAGILVSSGIGKTVNYSYEIPKVEVNKMKNFIDSVRKGQVSNIILLGIERKNAPLTNSPTLKLDSKNIESLDDSLKELEETHKLQIMSEIENIVSITIGIDTKAYKFLLVTVDNETTINFDNRNLSEGERNKIKQVLNDAIQSK